MKNKKLKNAILNVFYVLLAFAVILSVWAIAAKVKGNEFLLPPPATTLSAFFNLLGEKLFWTSVGWTFLRVLESFVISFVLAFVFAVIGGLFTPFHKVMSPIITVLRAAPTLAVILLAMIWIEYEQVAILVGVLIAFPVLYQAFYTAITGVDKDLLEMCTLYKVSPFNRVKSVFVPSIAPAVFDVSSSTLSLTTKVIVAAEILCHTKSSIGLEMQRANLAFEIKDLLAWMIVAIVLSFILEYAVKGLKRLWEVAR